MKKLLGFIILLFTIVIVLPAQQIDEDKAREELERRGVDEDEIRKRMLDRGIDIDNIDPTNATEVLRAEKALEEVIAELERKNEKVVEQVATELGNEAAEEKAEVAVEKEAENLAKENAQDIKDAVEDGATLDEAIAEEIVDNVQESLPQATIYGQHVFRDKSIAVFSKSNDVRPPDTYILGVGDRINISIWGDSQEDATYEINETGYIKPSQMPRINLKGISFGKAKNYY